jgi:hypothetical protein
MWTELFKAIGQGFKFLRALVKPKKTAVDAAAQRAGTAAGAAANEASHKAGPPSNPQQKEV